MLSARNPRFWPGAGGYRRAGGAEGALKIGADYLKRLSPNATVHQQSSWENHRSIFENARFKVDVYRRGVATRGVDFPAMKAKLDTLPAGSIIVLHACCRNPTGESQRSAMARNHPVMQAPWSGSLHRRGLPGFAGSIKEDALALNLFVASGAQFFGFDVLLQSLPPTVW